MRGIDQRMIHVSRHLLGEVTSGAEHDDGQHAFGSVLRDADSLLLAAGSGHFNLRHRECYWHREGIGPIFSDHRRAQRTQEQGGHALRAAAAGACRVLFQLHTRRLTALHTLHTQAKEGFVSQLGP